MVYFCHSENSCMNCIVKNQILLRIGMGWMIVTQNVIQIIRSHQKTQNYTYVKNDIDKGKKGSNSSCRPTCWHILFRKTVANRGRTTTTMSKHSTMLKEEELKPVQMENREETTHNNAGAESLRLRDRDSSRSRQGSENWKASCANEWSKNGEDPPLPISVFLVASVLKDKSTMLLQQAKGLDDVVKVWFIHVTF